jgi:uroporphyrinogen III methyltransferase/synthase
MTPAPGRVYLIGAGPGDPGLLTVRGLRLLADADVVIYDQAAEAALRWARPDAERIAVGAPAERAVAQDAISMLIAENARDGHTVARLKWGDPFVFDSGAKEALFLHEQGIAFEVVPGVPSAIGAAAYAGIPLTHPDAGDAVVLIRGHEGEIDTIPSLDWRALASLEGTIVCHAGPRLVTGILRALVDEGRPADDAAALVYRGTLPSQHTITGTIGELLDLMAAGAPSDGAAGLLVVGDVTRLREHVRWFDTRPLFGRRIIITRSPDRARELADALENLGAETLVAPTFRLVPPDDPEAVERATASMDRFDWIVFESAVAAARFLGALARSPRDLRAFGRTSICAVGPSTADQLHAAGLKPDVVIPELGVDTVANAMAAHAQIDGRSILVVRPDDERNVVSDALAARGATVTDLLAYRTEADPPDSPAAQQIYRMLLDGQVDAVTFTSPTAVRRFASLIGDEQAADLLGTTVVAAIGPVTAAAAAELGIRATVIAETFTVDGLVQALVRHFGGNSETG